LAQEAALERLVELYQANARLLPDGPGEGRVLYYDPVGSKSPAGTGEEGFNRVTARLLGATLSLGGARLPAPSLVHR